MSKPKNADRALLLKAVRLARRGLRQRDVLVATRYDADNSAPCVDACESIVDLLKRPARQR